MSFLKVISYDIVIFPLQTELILNPDQIDGFHVIFSSVSY